MNVLSVSSTAFRRPGMLDAAQRSTVTVQYGDTMTGIAQRLNVPFDKLRDANPQIVDPNWIYPGDVLTVPEHTPAAIAVADTLLTGQHSMGSFFGGGVASTEKEETTNPQWTLMASSGERKRDWGASRITKYENGQWQQPKVKHIDKPAMTWEKELIKIENNKSQKTLIESKYFNAGYQKEYEKIEVRAQAIANSEELNFEAVASVHKAVHRMEALGGVDNLHAKVEAEALSYYGKASVNAKLDDKGVSIGLDLGAGAHLGKAHATVTLETPGIFGFKGRAQCTAGVSAGVEGRAGAVVEMSTRKMEFGMHVAASVGVGANAKCSVGVGFYD